MNMSKLSQILLKVDSTQTVPYGIQSVNAIGCGSNSACVAVGSSQANAGQIISSVNSGNTWTDEFSTTVYTYDQDNHELSMQDGQGYTGITDYTYDALGRLSSQTDDFNVTTGYGYDLVNPSFQQT
jgi:YD repeat-containing protein